MLIFPKMCWPWVLNKTLISINIRYFQLLITTICYAQIWALCKLSAHSYGLKFQVIQTQSTCQRKKLFEKYPKKAVQKWYSVICLF